MSDVLGLDVAGRTGRSWTAAEWVALEEAAALARELREQLAQLAPPCGAWPGWDERTVLEQGLAGIEQLRDALPELADVHPWSEREVRDAEARVDRRALAACRALEELVRRGRNASARAVTM